jgi:hypothetical protein
MTSKLRVARITDLVRAAMDAGAAWAPDAQDAADAAVRHLNQLLEGLPTGRCAV